MPVGLALVAARRAVSSWVLGGSGAEVGIGRTARAGVGAAWWPASGSVFGAAAVSAGALRRCACSGVGVRGASAFASAGRLPPRARRGGRLGSWRSSASRTRRPTSCPIVIRGSTCESSPRSCSSPCWTLRVDSRLQLVAAIAERAHPVGRRRKFRVQVGQHPADLPGALAGRLFDQLPPTHRIQHQRRRLRLGRGQRYGRRGVCRRRPRRCDRRGAGDRPAAPLPVERPLQLRGGAQRQRAVAQPLPRVRLIGAQPHGADAPSGCCVAEAELAHRVVEQAGEASFQIQPARLDLGQVVDDGALQVPFVADQVPGLPQQLAVGEGADGGRDRGPGGGRERCGLSCRKYTTGFEIRVLSTSRTGNGSARSAR